MRVVFFALLLFARIAAASPDVGINLSIVNYWSPEHPFINIMKTNSKWRTSTATTFDTGEADRIPLDSDGYPTRLDGTGADGLPVNYDRLTVLLLNDTKKAPYYPTGQYVLTYDGEGTFNFSNMTVVSTAPGRIVVNAATATNNGVTIRLLTTNPSNYVKNIKFFRAAHESLLNQGEIFNPDFLRRLTPFSTVRFMDWQRTNNSPQSEWTDRPLMSNVFWGTENGVPLEVLCALANKGKFTPWFHIPHQATDDYITQFATAVKQLLTQNQEFYIEYSNETWNGIFTQTTYVANQGLATWPTALSPVNSSTLFTWGGNYHGMRSSQMCDIFNTVWGGKAWRVKCVQATWAANTTRAKTQIECTMWVDKPCDKKHGIRHLAIAPYFASNQFPTTFTVDQLFTEIMEGGLLTDSSAYVGGQIKKAADRISDYTTTAKTYDMTLIAYEGGQHLQSSNTTLTNLYIAANRDVRMGEAFEDYLKTWNRIVGDNLFVVFNLAYPYTVSGTWGILESIYQTDEAYKWNAVVNFANGH